LPYAVATPAEKPTGGDKSAEGQDEQTVLYDVLNTVAFDRDGAPHIYGHDVTLSVGLVETKGGQFTAYTDDGRYVTVKINAAKRVRHYRPHTVIGHYRYDVSVVEQTLVDEGEPSAQEVELLVARRMDEAMQSAFDVCRQDGVDIFSVSGHLYKRYGEVVPLELCEWQRNVEVKCK
jgi:hypothetical protein